MRHLKETELNFIAGGYESKNYEISTECLVALNGFWAFITLAPDFGYDRESDLYINTAGDFLKHCDGTCGSEITSLMISSMLSMSEALHKH